MDNSSVVLALPEPHTAVLAGQLFLGEPGASFLIRFRVSGGVPAGYPVPERIAATPRFRGCMSHLKLGKDHMDIWADAEQSLGVEKGCLGKQANAWLSRLVSSRYGINIPGPQAGFSYQGGTPSVRENQNMALKWDKAVLKGLK